MRGAHRLGRTDKTLLWGTAALIAFTLGAVAVARTNGGTNMGADTAHLCYNSAGVGSACLPPPPPVDEVAPVPAAATPTKVAPQPSETSPTVTPPSPSLAAPGPVRTTTRPPATKKATVPAWTVGVAYRGGSRVSYQGRVYACTQAHTSQVDWSPVDAPVLWSRVA